MSVITISDCMRTGRSRRERDGPRRSLLTVFYRRRFLVWAAFFAAAERRAAPLVLAALTAAAERADAERRDAACRVCFDSALRDVVLRGSRLRARDTARETRGRRRGFRLP